jgi:peptide/nickel transport system substrate-binding protein
MITRRHLLIASASGVALGSQATAPVRLRDAASVAIVGGWEINGLETNVGGYHFTRAGVLETLVTADSQGVLVAGLAASFVPSDDQLTWRFTLRKDARFHDGTPVQTLSVVQMLERAAGRPGLLKSAPIATITPERSDIVIRLHRPYSLLASILTHSTTAILAPASLSSSGATERIIGSGPFAIDELVPPQRFSVKRFPGWSRGPVALERARYLSAGRAESRALLAHGGESDVTFGIDAASAMRLARLPHLRIQRAILPRTYLVKVNAGHRWLQDRSFRWALSAAVDRQGIAQALLRDRTLAATQLLPPSLGSWHVSSLAPLTFDVARARRLLDEGGYRVGGDGIRVTPQGERVALTLTTYPDRPELPLIATVLQEQWRQVGIAVRLSIGNSSDIPRGHANGTLHLGLAARNYALSPDPTATLVQDFSEVGADWGAMNWRDESLVADLRRLAEGVALSDRNVLRTRVISVLQRELPVIPIAWSQQTVAVNTRVEGLVVDPFERSYGLEDMRISTRPAR